MKKIMDIINAVTEAIKKVPAQPDKHGFVYIDSIQPKIYDICNDEKCTITGMHSHSYGRVLFAGDTR